MPRPINAPFFEIGPKTFLDRASLLELADAASAASVRQEVDIILTPPALDLEAVKQCCPALWVFAQSMDVAKPGASTGALLPEAIAGVGADGVMLNHAERPMDEHTLRAAIARARDVGLLTLVCAANASQAARYAGWNPNLILVEPHNLIGTANGRHRPSIAQANAAVARINPGVLVMHSGGVADERDARAIIAQGAAGTGSTTAIVDAADRCGITTRMIRAVREGWEAQRNQLASPAANDTNEVR